MILKILEASANVKTFEVLFVLEGLAPRVLFLLFNHICLWKRTFTFLWFEVELRLLDVGLVFCAVRWGFVDWLCLSLNHFVLMQICIFHKKSLIFNSFVGCFEVITERRCAMWEQRILDGCQSFRYENLSWCSKSWMETHELICVRCYISQFERLLFWLRARCHKNLNLYFCDSFLSINIPYGNETLFTTAIKKSSKNLIFLVFELFLAFLSVHKWAQWNRLHFFFMTSFLLSKHRRRNSPEIENDILSLSKSRVVNFYHWHTRLICKSIENIQLTKIWLHFWLDWRLMRFRFEAKITFLIKI